MHFLNFLNSFRHIRTSSFRFRAPLRFLHTNGEILPSSHPHILKDNESMYIIKIPLLVMPGIPVSDFANRRAQLSKSIPTNSAILILGNRIRYASGSVL